MSRSRSPSLFRWIVVGVPCYLSWLVANILLFSLFPLYIAVELIGRTRGRRFLRQFCVFFLRLFFLGHLPLVGVYRVEKSPDLARLRRLGPCLVVANHTSWLDGLILFALIPDVRILVATKYQNVPLVRHPMRWLESIAVDRQSRDSVLDSVREMGLALTKATPVAVFPEGTRGSPGHLKPFGDLSFRIAIDAGAAVQPVLLHLDEPFLGPGAENFLTARKATLKIRVLERVSPVPGERGRDLAFRVRAAMKKALEALEKGGTPQNGERDG